MTKSFFKPFLDIIEQALKTGKKQPPASYGDMIIINPQGQFLILERANSDDFENNQWCLPGGHIEVGESPVVAAHREAQEETNLEIDFETVEYVKEKDLSDGRKISYFVCSIDVIGDKVVLDTQEHQNYAWILPEQILDYNFIFDLSDTLCEVFDVKKVEVETDILNIEDQISNITVILNKALDEGSIDDDTYIHRINQIQSIEKRYAQDIVKGFREKKISNKKEVSSEEELSLDMKEQYKDYIANSFIYQGKLYDKDGIGIITTPEEVKQYSKNGAVFNADLYEEVEPKTTLKALDPKREKFQEVLPKIKRYEEYYTKYENELANQYNSSQNNFIQRRQEIKKVISETPDILTALNAVKREFRDDIDPLLTVRFKNDKPSRVAFLSELERYIESNPENTVRDFTIRDLEDFDAGEFKVNSFKFGDIDSIAIIQKKAAEKIQRNTRVEKELSKALDLELISEDKYLKTLELLKGDSSEKLETDLDTAITLPNDEGKEQDYSEAQLREHAKNSSLTQLESVIKNSNSPALRELAHQEIKRREEEEHVKDQEIEKGETLKGCTMYFPLIDKETWNQKIKELIPEDIVIEYEDDPHITLLYGHDHENTDLEILKKELKKAIDETPIEFTTEPISLFENENDVVKIGIQSDSLSKLNSLIREKFPYKTNFPDYKPHITLAYVKKGEGQAFAHQEVDLKDWGLKEGYEGEVIYSSPEKEKTILVEIGKNS